MPRKFKLIKEYPGSVELGSVATFNTKMDLYGIANHPFLYPKEIVENQPEFWEEIKEPDYEILSIRHKDGSVKNIYTKQNSTHYDWKQYILFEKGKHDFLEINSVKRLSDGEIFTIGDDTRYGFIKKFYIKDNFLLANASLESMPIHLSGLEKMKILFCTKDGIEVRKNDTVWCIRSGFRVEESIASKETNFLGPIFHCQKTAEEYALLNKPCLSINDINNFLQVENSTDWKYNYSSRLYLEKLKAFVKSKL